MGSAVKRLLNGVTMSPLRRIYAPLVQRVTALDRPGRPGRRPDAVSREELLAGAPHISPMAHQPCRRGQPFENHGPVALCDDAPVQQHDGSHVSAAADQAPESLLQL